MSNDLEEPEYNLNGILLSLRFNLAHHIGSRSSGKGGHDGDGNSWAVVEIPDWQVKQYISSLEILIKKATDREMASENR